MKKLIILCAAVCITALNTARAQTAIPDTATKNFIIKASIGGMQEVVSGQLATQKAVDPAIRSYGSRMVADHTKAQAQLMQAVKLKSYNIPPQVTGKQMPDMMLKNASGKDFDRVYVHMMVPDHLKTLLLFQKYATTGKDPQIKAFAKQNLPVLKEHLAAITAIEKRLKDQASK